MVQQPVLALQQLGHRVHGIVDLQVGVLPRKKKAQSRRMLGYRRRDHGLHVNTARAQSPRAGRPNAAALIAQC